jgi:hypothetical protein
MRGGGSPAGRHVALSAPSGDKRAWEGRAGWGGCLAAHHCCWHAMSSWNSSISSIEGMVPPAAAATKGRRHRDGGIKSKRQASSQAAAAGRSTISTPVTVANRGRRCRHQGLCLTPGRPVAPGAAGTHRRSILSSSRPRPSPAVVQGDEGKANLTGCASARRHAMLAKSLPLASSPVS